MTNPAGALDLTRRRPPFIGGATSASDGARSGRPAARVDFPVIPRLEAEHLTDELPPDDQTLDFVSTLSDLADLSVSSRAA